MSIRPLFQLPLDRAIEKVITFAADSPERLGKEIEEYIVTPNLCDNFRRLLSDFDQGMSGGGHEIGVWISGFYGSGKSSFAKYLGFALDPSCVVNGAPFLDLLAGRIEDAPVKAQLKALARRHPTTVVMLDLASEQLAGATMAEISTVLFWKVMQWAGYPRDKKLSLLQLKLEEDGRFAEFEGYVRAQTGMAWSEIQNQPMVAGQVAATLAPQIYPHIFANAKAFFDQKIEEAELEDGRVRAMIDLVRRKGGRENVLFILDEVGQYVAARQNLILNLDGLAKNIKQIGGGRAWLLATAQQTLTEDEPAARLNSADLFKLADRFPLRVDLKADDIATICVRRLLQKNIEGQQTLAALYDANSATLKFYTQLKNTRSFKRAFEQQSFVDLYPFLPAHFEILLQLLSQLSKISGGLGLRSAIKVIQDTLVDQTNLRPGAPKLADAPLGCLATVAHFYDTLKTDLERASSTRHAVAGVQRVEATADKPALALDVAKGIAALQALSDFPTTRENLAALLHPRADAPSQFEPVSEAVAWLLDEPAFHLAELDERLLWMSEAVADLETQRKGIIPSLAQVTRERSERLKSAFSPLPSVRLNAARTVSVGVRVPSGTGTASLLGEREAVQITVEFVLEANYEARREMLLVSSNELGARNTLFLLAREPEGAERWVGEIVRSREIAQQNRNSAEKPITDYIAAQEARVAKDEREVERLLRAALLSGSFVFRGSPSPVAERGDDLPSALNAQLKLVADGIFEKYAEAPISAEAALAEKFLSTSNLNALTHQSDPLSLIKSGRVQTAHEALVSLADYLRRNGVVDGRRLLDDFFEPPFGWSKDTTRYLLAALLTAGELKLRIGGADVVVRGDGAREAFKNNVNFGKIAVSLRTDQVPNDVLGRASERLLKLTGQSVLPLEDEIARVARKGFPRLADDYAPLEARLGADELLGAERAARTRTALGEVVRGDASSAASRLGAPECQLFDDLVWLREVKRALDNGLGEVARELRALERDIAALPDVETLADLKREAAPSLERARDILLGERFFEGLADLHTRRGEVRSVVARHAIRFGEELARWLDERRQTPRQTPDFVALAPDDRERFARALDALALPPAHSIEELRALLVKRFEVEAQLLRLQSAIRDAVPADPQPGEASDSQHEVALSPIISSLQELSDLIARLTELQSVLQNGGVVRLRF